MEALLLEVMKRLHALFSRKGFFEQDGGDARPPGALESLQQEAALGQRSFPLPEAEVQRPRVRAPRSAFREGFTRTSTCTPTTGKRSKGCACMPGEARWRTRGSRNCRMDASATA